MIISNQKNVFYSKIKDTILTKVSTVKFLYVTLDENRNFNDHVNRVTTKISMFVKKVTVFYGQEPSSGESTTTECGINYQLLAVNNEVQFTALLIQIQFRSNIQIQFRYFRSNLLVEPPPSWALPLERLVHSINRSSSAIIRITAVVCLAC